MESKVGVAGAQSRIVLWVSPQPPAKGLSPALAEGVQIFGGAAAGNGLMDARAELDAPHVFHGRFANVPEQGEVPKQITMQDTAHPSPPSCPWLVLRHLPCLGGREGRRAWPAVRSCPTPPQVGCVCWRGEGSTCLCVCVCWLPVLSPSLPPRPAGAGVRSGQLSLSLQVGQVGRINFLFCPSHTVLALFHGSSSAQGIEIHQHMQCLWVVFLFPFFFFFFFVQSLRIAWMPLS